MHYSDYLQLDKILNAQQPESDKLGIPAHDEMRHSIVIHQAYELWFRQLLYETGSDYRTPSSDSQRSNDNSPELQTIVHRLSRCATAILEGFGASDRYYGDDEPNGFPGLPRSAAAGLGFPELAVQAAGGPAGPEIRTSRRKTVRTISPSCGRKRSTEVRAAENARTLLQLLNDWLGRMPFFDEQASEPPSGRIIAQRYQSSLADAEKGNLEAFDTTFFGHPAAGAEAAAGAASGADAALRAHSFPGRSLSPSACRSALFIMLYRGYPLLQLPFQILHQLLEIDEQLSTWRYRHMSMVHRTIGTRIGTGGSSGRDYLAAAARTRHHLFREIAALTSFLIQRKSLPELAPEIQRRLGFGG